MKKNYLNKIKMFVLIFTSMLILFNGCMKEARSQDDKLVSERLVNWVDTVVTVQIAPLTDAVIMFADSSNSTTDTFKVYLVSTFGDEVLACLTKLNDTTANSLEVPKSLGTVIPGDGVIRYYKVQCSGYYQLKIVRTNVASISGTAVTGKVSHVSVQAFRASGVIETEYKDYTFQDTEVISPGLKNPGFY